MTVNEMISLYLAAKAEQSAADKVSREAKARAEALALDLVRIAGDAGQIDTDQYTVNVKTETRIILDQSKLFHDFPGIKNLDQYGKESPRTVITALARQAAGQKSA